VPILSDRWDGLDQLFDDGDEIVIADTIDDALAALDAVDADRRTAMGAALRRRVLTKHTAAERVTQLEQLVAQVGRVEEAV
jgi:spore maturation protein CgeB